MRNKIAVRLLAYFALALLLFSIVISGMFAWMFSQYTTNLHRQELSDRAVGIAETMGEFMDSGIKLGSHGPGGGYGGGYGAYIRYLDDIAMTDAWLVDRQSNQITRGHGDSAFSYKELPEDAEHVIASVLEGEIAFSESFSDFLEQKTLTVGAPILSADGAVQGAVLLHSPIDGLTEARQNQYRILGISLLVALILTAPMAALFTMRFTKPLNRMKEISAKLAEGDYGAKNNIRQHDEIGELADAMDILADQLAETNRQRDEMEGMRQAFFSNISHELRTPVTVMRGSLEALCDGVVTEPEQVTEYHRQMLGESIHLQRLVNDLLELSRLQSVDFQMDMGELNLCEIVEDVARSMRRVAEQKRVIIKTENLDENVPFHGDYSRLRQMLLVVVDNAVKFSPEGDTVTISRMDQDGQCCLAVIDHGLGIAAADLPYIFERFHKARSEQNRQGSGLGLAIAKEIAARHGIEIVVTSRLRQTEFQFLLPGYKITHY